jgi:hypothetical protein
MLAYSIDLTLSLSAGTMPGRFVAPQPICGFAMRPARAERAKQSAQLPTLARHRPVLVDTGRPAG